ncbi:fido domain-containing protein [Nemania sp. FL0916]|nr:fido domain-containing protein [Nemania sp. FL0916]
MENSLYSTLVLKARHLYINFTLCTADYLRTVFRRYNLERDPVDIINTAKSTFPSERFSVPSELLERITERLEDAVCHVVFGSNLIENKGADFAYTADLCRRICHGEPIDITDTDQHTPKYDQLLHTLKFRNLPEKQTDQPAITRARCEIIQHVQALLWAIDNTVLAETPWTEDVVKSIHRILCADMSDNDGAPGEYRDTEYRIAIKYTDPKTGEEMVSGLVDSHDVPSHMANWVESLNNDIQQAKGGISFDPYDMSAKHYHHFINIHPFGEGNAQTARIILNCLVLKFTGHMIPMGEDESEKDEFLKLVIRSAREHGQENGEVDPDEMLGHRGIARFMARKSVAPLIKMIQ